MDRVPDFESDGWEFESLRGHFLFGLTSNPHGGDNVRWLGVRTPLQGTVSLSKPLPFRCCIIKTMAKTVIGRERSWQIGKPLGSGDAGEVLQAISTSGNFQGVMKRSVQNVSGGTIIRQATQIETEG